MILTRAIEGEKANIFFKRSRSVVNTHLFVLVEPSSQQPDQACVNSSHFQT